MLDAPQGSQSWLRARLGRATASRIADIVAKTKSGWGASRENYLAELVAERLTGIPAESYTNGAMQHGIDTEPQARAEYAFAADVDVIEVGFVDHPRIAMAGASPDGMIGDEGLVELKAPNTATHLRTLLGEPIAGKYITQIQWQLACTGRAWCDLCSFDPRLPDYARLFIKRVYRDDKMIAELEVEVLEFLREVDKKTAAVRALGAK
jgi:predicted phage-related endonuclease